MDYASGLMMPGPSQPRGYDLASMLASPFGYLRPQKSIDQNNPMMWGLGEVIERRADTMADPNRYGEKYGQELRRQTEERELDILRRTFGGDNNDWRS